MQHRAPAVRRPLRERDAGGDAENGGERTGERTATRALLRRRCEGSALEPGDEVGGATTTEGAGVLDFERALQSA
ncbi:MAG TPA: hypothetical protein VK655_08755 [Solirubrobacteraceae bacterium]|nr:hypothetical protein [Solirubrobacteraceae bacterium]